MSQWTFRASRCSVEILEGRIIHLITRDTTSGDALLDFSVERKVSNGFGVVECRASRWRVQSGILDHSLGSANMKIRFGSIERIIKRIYYSREY